jgi:4-hydroxy-tetrahydrodipicolinate synthase
MGNVDKLDDGQPLAGGLWGILATPFHGPKLTVDTVSLGRQVEFFRDLPSTGVVALGVFGEGASLDSREQREVISTVVSTGGAMPVVVGLSSRATAPAIEQGLIAVEATGATLAGLMVQVNSSSPAVLVRHLSAIHAATGAGIVLQDYPLVSGVTISSAQILQTIAECPFILAVKSEAPPTALAIAELTAKTAVPVFGGLGGVGLIDELAAGAAGAMTGFSRPEGLLAAIQAFRAGGMGAAAAAFARWLPLANFEAQPKIGLALRKEAFRLRGIFESAAVREPAAGMPAHLGVILQHHMDQLDKDNA